MFAKRFKGLVILLFAFVLGGCGLFRSTENEPTPEEPTEQVDEVPEENENDTVDEENEPEEPSTDLVSQELEVWMPRLENVFYTFVGDGNEFASYTWYPQFNQENYYQVATSNPGTTLGEVFEYQENQIVRTFRMGEVYYRDNFTSIGTTGDGSAEEVVLQLPIEVGTSWSGEDSMYEITAVNHEIEVPAGVFNTIEVTNTFENSVTKRYYAEDVGLVLVITELENGEEVTSSLESIDTDVPEIISLTVYIPDEQAMGMDKIDAQLTLETNDPARIALTQLLSGQVEGYEDLNILPEGTEINYLFKNDQGVVEVDVSEEFEKMNAGSTGELFFIYNLVNTLSQYYGTDEVLLTVEGQPFEGGHMVLEEGETLHFNEDMVNE